MALEMYDDVGQVLFFVNTQERNAINAPNTTSTQWQQSDIATNQNANYKRLTCKAYANANQTPPEYSLQVFVDQASNMCTVFRTKQDPTGTGTGTGTQHEILRGTQWQAVTLTAQGQADNLSSSELALFNTASQQRAAQPTAPGQQQHFTGNPSTFPATRATQQPQPEQQTVTPLMDAYDDQGNPLGRVEHVALANKTFTFGILSNNSKELLSAQDMNQLVQGDNTWGYRTLPYALDPSTHTMYHLTYVTNGQINRLIRSKPDAAGAWEHEEYTANTGWKKLTTLSQNITDLLGADANAWKTAIPDTLKDVVPVAMQVYDDTYAPLGELSFKDTDFTLNDNGQKTALSARADLEDLGDTGGSHYKIFHYANDLTTNPPTTYRLSYITDRSGGNTLIRSKPNATNDAWKHEEYDNQNGTWIAARTSAQLALLQAKLGDSKDFAAEAAKLVASSISVASNPDLHALCAGIVKNPTHPLHQQLTQLQQTQSGDYICLVKPTDTKQPATRLTIEAGKITFANQPSSPNATNNSTLPNPQAIIAAIDLLVAGDPNAEIKISGPDKTAIEKIVADYIAQQQTAGKMAGVTLAGQAPVTNATPVVATPPPNPRLGLVP